MTKINENHLKPTGCLDIEITDLGNDSGATVPMHVLYNGTKYSTADYVGPTQQNIMRP